LRPQEAAVDSREWVLKRNCSLTPRQFVHTFVLLCTVSLSVASAFAMHGYWYVLGFSVVENLAVGLAFLLYARHASDRERIALEDGCLLVERIEGEEVTRFRLDPRKTRVEPPGRTQPLVALLANGESVEVGRFVTERTRRELARELRMALAAER
jgi:uncharacterized membrane protein